MREEGEVHIGMVVVQKIQHILGALPRILEASQHRQQTAVGVLAMASWQTCLENSQSWRGNFAKQS